MVRAFGSGPSRSPRSVPPWRSAPTIPGFLSSLRYLLVASLDGSGRMVCRQALSALSVASPATPRTDIVVLVDGREKRLKAGRLLRAGVGRARLVDQGLVALRSRPCSTEGARGERAGDS